MQDWWTTSKGEHAYNICVMYMNSSYQSWPFLSGKIRVYMIKLFIHFTSEGHYSSVCHLSEIILNLS